MIEVSDLSHLIPPGFQHLDEAIRLVIPDLIEATRSELVNLAQQRLTTTAEDYVQGLQPARWSLPQGKFPDGDVDVATIVLLGWLPNAVEHGWQGGNMRAWLLLSRKAKQGGKGPYLVIPFRQGTPGTTGHNFPTMGSQYRYAFVSEKEGGFRRVGRLTEQGAKALGSRIHALANRLRPTTQTEQGTKWGERLPAGLAPRLRPHHKTDAFAGMVRKQGKGSSSYSTFRTVSAASDPRAWQHPGIEGHRLFRAVTPYVEQTAAGLMQLAIGQLTGGK